MQPLEKEVEMALEKKRKEKFKKTPYAKMMVGSLSEDASTSSEMAEAEKMVCNEIVDYVFDAADESAADA